MSDPTWASRDLPQIDEGIIYVQAAGTVTAVAAADELAFVTDLSIDIKGDRKKKGPWIHYSKQKTITSGVGFSGKATIDWSKAADDVRELCITNAIAGTKVKITFISYTNGDQWVMDNAALDASIAVKADGQTGDFTWDSDTCVYTAATA